jgi:vitamin B12 transporter
VATNFKLPGALVAAGISLCLTFAIPMAEENPIDIAPVEVTWQRPTFLDSTAPVIVIEPSPGDVRAGRTVADLLETTAGFQILRSGSAGQAQKVTMRGGNSRQVVVLLEGIPIADPGTATADLSLLPLDAVESIEVYRGAAGAQAGSGAQGGAVVIRLRRGGKSEYSQRLYSSFYAPDLVDGGGGTLTLRHRSLFLHYGHETRDGDFPFVDTNGSSRKRTNNRTTTDRVAATWRWRPTQGIRVDFLGNMGLVARGSPGVEQFPSLEATEARQNLLSGTRLDWRRFLVDSGRLQAGVSYGFWQFHFTDPSPYIGPPVDNHGRSHRTRLDASASANPTPWLTLELESSTAVEAMERTGSEPVLAKDRTLSDGALRATLGESGLPVDAMLSIGIASTGTDPLAVLPNLSIGYRPWSPLRIAAVAGRSYRAPAFDELYFSASGIRGNPDLAPEDTWNAGLDMEATLGPLAATVSGYYQRLAESIMFLPVSPYLVEAQNTGAIDAFGVEAALAARFGPVTLNSSFAWLDARFAKGGNQVPFKSAYTASLGGRMALGRFTGYVTGLYRSPFTLDRFESRTEEWRLLLDAGLSAELVAGFQLAVDARNLLDKRDRIDAFQHPLPGLSWHVSLQHRWRGER